MKLTVLLLLISVCAFAQKKNESNFKKFLQEHNINTDSIPEHKYEHKMSDQEWRAISDSIWNGTYRWRFYNTNYCACPDSDQKPYYDRLDTLDFNLLQRGIIKTDSTYMEKKKLEKKPNPSVIF